MPHLGTGNKKDEFVTNFFCGSWWVAYACKVQALCFLVLTNINTQYAKPTGLVTGQSCAIVHGPYVRQT